MNTWIKRPPRPRGSELRRVVAQEPVKIEFVYEEGPTARATVVLSMGADVLVLTHFGEPGGPSGSVLFDSMAATLDHFEVAFRTAARELREGPTPC